MKILNMPLDNRDFNRLNRDKKKTGYSWQNYLLYLLALKKSNEEVNNK